MKKIGLTALLTFLIIFALKSPGQAQTLSPQQTLQQYLSDLQKNPNDKALREKIIKHVQTMTPKPAIPEEAERYMARGAAAVKGAKADKEFQEAATEFEKASLAAPWLPAAYYNLGLTQDKAGKYKEAIQSLKLYLLTAPGAPDAKAVKTLIYEVEYRQEKAQKETDKKLTEQKAKINLELLTGEYSENRWNGVKFNWVPGVGSKPFSLKPTRNGPWGKGSGSNIHVQISDSKITITMRAISPQSIWTSAIYQGTIRGTGIEGTMTETYSHRFSCPKIVGYRFEGTIWPEEQEIMLITEDCRIDGNPQHGLGCNYHQSNCFMNSYLLTKK